MKTYARILLALVCATSLSVAAGPVIHASGGAANTGWSAGGNGLIADDFHFAAGGSTVTGMRWSGGHTGTSTPPVSETFVVRIYGDAGGSPNLQALLYTLEVTPTRTDTGTDVSLDGIYRDLLAYSADWAPIELQPNTIYWLSIARLGDPDSTAGWFWGAQTGTGNAKFGTETDYWTSSDYAMDFELIGQDKPVINRSAVPVPATLALFGIGFAGLWAGRRRNRMGRD